MYFQHLMTQKDILISKGDNEDRTVNNQNKTKLKSWRVNIKSVAQCIRGSCGLRGD